MKRILLFLVLIPIFCSCGQGRRMPCLEDHPYTLSGELQYNGCIYSVLARVYDEDTCDITIESPPELKGYSFKVDKSSVWVYYDNIGVEMKTDVINIPFLYITEMLSFSPEDFEYFRTESDGIVYRYTKDMYPLTVYTDKDDNAPRRIEFTREGCELILDIEAVTDQ